MSTKRHAAPVSTTKQGSIRSKGKPRGTPFPKGRSGNPSTQFQPGKSGNPGGRPKKLKELEEELLRNWGPKYENVISRLYIRALAGDVQAAKEFGDRVVGKARQRVELTGKDGKPIETEDKTPETARTTEEMRARLAQLLGRARRPGGVLSGPVEVAPEDDAAGSTDPG